MIEAPEAVVISRQITEAFAGRTIESAVAGASPHGFAWYYGPPEAYGALLAGKTVRSAKAVAGYVEIALDGATMLFGEGVNLRRIAPGAKRPKKHQLLAEMDDGSALAGSVQMYGGLWAYPDTHVNDNPYYRTAAEKPSPLTEAFDAAYFDAMRAQAKDSLSAKAFLATEQRIPGLGNGVLQDILFLGGIHPARQVRTLTDADLHRLFVTLKETLARMATEGGRDTEKDLHGNAGGYRTLLSRKTVGYPCPGCGGPITRKAYLGGNVYFCEACQPLVK